MQTLLEIAIAMTAGLFVSRLAKMLKLPAVTGYLVAGILVGPYFLGRLGIGGQVLSMRLRYRRLD